MLRDFVLAIISRKRWIFGIALVFALFSCVSVLLYRPMYIGSLVLVLGRSGTLEQGFASRSVDSPHNVMAKIGRKEFSERIISGLKVGLDRKDIQLLQESFVSVLHPAERIELIARARSGEVVEAFLSGAAELIIQEHKIMADLQLSETRAALRDIDRIVTDLEKRMPNSRLASVELLSNVGILKFRQHQIKALLSPNESYPTRLLDKPRVTPPPTFMRLCMFVLVAAIIGAGLSISMIFFRLTDSHGNTNES